MKKKQKIDLFRFVTLRAPQLISKERKELGFIEHDDKGKSHFLKRITNDENILNARSEVESAVGSFTAYKTVEEVKIASRDLWDFSMWLGKNKNNLSRNEILNNIPASSPSASVMFKMWDNVFYDIITKKNSPIRQACLQVIVANNFVRKYDQLSLPINGELEKEKVLFKRLANGKVVMHQAFTRAKSRIQSSSLNLISKSFKKHEAQHTAKLSCIALPEKESIKAELKRFEKQYVLDYNKAIKLDNDSTAEQNDQIVSEYIATNGIEDGTLSIEEQIPDGIIEESKFEFQKPLSREYTEGKLSPEAMQYIGSNTSVDDSVSQVVEKIGLEIKSTRKVAAQSTRKKVKEVRVNGVQLTASDSLPQTFSVSFEKETNKAYFSLYTGYSGAFLKSSNFSIQMNDGNVFNSSNLNMICCKDDLVFGELPLGSRFKISEGQQFTFNASFELNNGKHYSIHKDGFYCGGLTSGIAVLGVLPTTGVEHYGINRIGVADYRRVEQELCCYVAGEVSHIENILAKEYKEKSTRQLTSTEVTTETSSEREVEELSDTTSTTRHEMSSEVAEVINKDRSANVGFSASASGKYGKSLEWGANAYGDFAFGKSTSDSNSEARTYAEDVTRRALERIVQKVSSKKTSRILREFEENNRHGFDNREGDKHVTGVYRWIDKVYKNRIVNYGKRLMYEFMIPEPSKFYKEAIIIEAEEEETTGDDSTGEGSTVLVKPTHPSENGIKDATSLTRENYSAKSALYGATPDAPMDKYNNASISKSESYGNKDKDQSYNYASDLRVPDSYQCVEITGAANYNYKRRSGNKAYIKVNVAGHNTQRTDIRGVGSAVLNIKHTNVNNIEGLMPVSVSAKKITGFTLGVTAKCILKTSVFGQWQQDVYDDIMRAYNDQLRAFNEAAELAKANKEMAEAGSGEGDNAINRNPRFNADIINTEIKRLCIEMLVAPFGIPQGKDFYEDGACDVPQLKLSSDLDVYASHVKFFEQAFDWNLLSQKFYPYYWAKRCDWKTLFQTQDGVDYLFQAFLQSGMGRIIVPVKEGFEDAVTYFMETGEIWNGTGLVVGTDDETYLSIVDEVTQIEGVVEGEEWETIVPSSLTLVQARSVLLDEEGLPCCESDEDVLAELNLLADTNVLALKDDTTI